MTGDTAQKKRGISNPVAVGLLLIFVIVVDVFAFLLVPALRQGGAGEPDLRVPRLLHQRQPRVPGPPRRVDRRRRAAEPGPDHVPGQPDLVADHDVHHHGPRDRPAVGAQPGPQDGCRGAARTRSSTCTSCSRTSACRWAGPQAKPYIGAVRRLLPADPVLQLERPRAADRQGRAAPRAHQRPERDHRPRAGRVRVHRVPGLQAPGRRLPRQVLPVRRVQERARRRASSPCSWA